MESLSDASEKILPLSDFLVSQLIEELVFNLCVWNEVHLPTRSVLCDILSRHHVWLHSHHLNVAPVHLKKKKNVLRVKELKDIVSTMVFERVTINLVLSEYIIIYHIRISNTEYWILNSPRLFRGVKKHIRISKIQSNLQSCSQTPWSPSS